VSRRQPPAARCRWAFWAAEQVAAVLSTWAGPTAVVTAWARSSLTVADGLTLRLVADAG
jgi:hypothetical protein